MGFLSKTARRSWLSENKTELAHALLSVNELEFLTQVYQMKKVLESLGFLCMICLNVQCQKAEIHKTDGTTVEIPTSEIDSITFSMTNPFNFETRTVRLNSGYDMPILGIGTYLLSTAQD